MIYTCDHILFTLFQPYSLQELTLDLVVQDIVLQDNKLFPHENTNSPSFYKKFTLYNNIKTFL